MAQTVKIESYDCGLNKCIKVNKHLVRTKKSLVVKFQNKLEADAVANIQFFDADDKGSTTPLSGFCVEESGTTLTVANNTKPKCTMAEVPGDYAYTVAATGHLTLDPIIIIEPQAAFFTTSLISFAALVVFATLTAFWLGGKKSNSSA